MRKPNAGACREACQNQNPSCWSWQWNKHSKFCFLYGSVSSCKWKKNPLPATLGSVIQLRGYLGTSAFASATNPALKPPLTTE